MAKSSKQKAVSDKDLDELLGPEPPKPAKKRGKIEQPAPVVKTFKEIMAEQPEKPKTEKPSKVKEPKAPRKLKGEMVTFKNKKGETITGMGQLYFCVSVKGKLHYKQFDAVEILDPNFTL